MTNFKKAVRRNKVAGKMFGDTFCPIGYSSIPKKVYWITSVCAGCDELKTCNADTYICPECSKKGIQ